MKPLTTGQGLVYATLIVIGTYIAACLLSALAIVGIGLWGHP